MFSASASDDLKTCIGKEASSHKSNASILKCLHDYNGILYSNLSLLPFNLLSNIKILNLTHYCTLSTF